MHVKKVPARRRASWCCSCQDALVTPITWLKGTIFQNATSGQWWRRASLPAYARKETAPVVSSSAVAARPSPSGERRSKRYPSRSARLRIRRPKAGCRPRAAVQTGRFACTSRPGSGPRQAGTRSAGVRVFCDGCAAPLARSAVLAATDPVSFGPSRSLRNSYSILAPACAFCPKVTAACDPMAQASGWRAQNWRMSETAAPAAETASAAPTRGAGFSLAGNNRTTMVSQNAAFNKNRMTLPFSLAAIVFLAAEETLAESLEDQVRRQKCILPTFDANSRQILRKIELSGFC